MNTSRVQAEIFRHFLNSQLENIQQDVNLIANQSVPLNLTIIPASILTQLCEHVRYLFSVEPTVLEITSPLVTVGDLHGHYLDLIRILQSCGLPNEQENVKYLFLGDIVDRGDFSLETIVLIYLLKACYPNNIFIIRGNHEFDSLCSKYGFFGEIRSEYHSLEIYQNFLTSFSYMPIGAIIDGVTICVHGGIGPSTTSIEIVKSVHRPIDNFLNQLINPLFWSDPSQNVTDFKPSQRGTGFLFGLNPLLNFLEASHAVRLIRGHECVQEGYASLFEDRCVTVFSASNYCGLSNNNGTVLILDPSGEDEVKTFPPLPTYKRSFAVFIRAIETPPPLFPNSSNLNPCLGLSLPQNMNMPQKPISISLSAGSVVLNENRQNSIISNNNNININMNNNNANVNNNLMATTATMMMMTANTSTSTLMTLAQQQHQIQQLQMQQQQRQFPVSSSSLSAADKKVLYKTRSPIPQPTPALQRLHELKCKHEVTKSTSFTPQRWMELKSIVAYKNRLSQKDQQNE